MKKFLLLLPALLIVTVSSAQTLDEIINKNYNASGAGVLEKAKTMYVEGKMSMMGMDMPMTMYMKQPDRIKMTITANGADIITLFDGEKGYMINPMMGSTDPVEIPADQLGSVKERNMFRNQLLDSYKAGQLTLVGTEDVNGKPAFKISAIVEGTTAMTYFIDKESYMIVKTTTKVNQMGQEMEVESIIKEYADINGYKFPKVTSTIMNGMEAGSTVFTVIEIDKPIDDSVFSLKK